MIRVILAFAASASVRFIDLAELAGRGIEAVGIAVIIIGAAVATGAFLRSLTRKRRRSEAYSAYRSRVGRSILLGLEFLVAADIIRTVAIEPTLSRLGVLAGIVFIRTFLSFTLEVEISGRWPWENTGSDRSDSEGGENAPAD